MVSEWLYAHWPYCLSLPISPMCYIYMLYITIWASRRLIELHNLLRRTGILCWIICINALAIIETTLKILTRWYYTPSKLQAIFPRTSGLGFCTRPLIGSFKHTYWESGQLSSVWSKVSSIASAISVLYINVLSWCPNSRCLKEERLTHTICVSTVWAIATLEVLNSFLVHNIGLSWWCHVDGKDLIYLIG